MKLPYLHLFSFKNKESFKELSLNLVSGEFPTNNNEIIISETINYNLETPYKVGDILSLDIGERKDEANNILNRFNSYTANEKLDNITRKQFKITGIVSSDYRIESHSDGSAMIITTNLESSKKDLYVALNKPKDYTSRDIVNIVGKVLKTKKVGHTGTLDPLAEGVLVVCIGRYTKLVDMLTCYDKEYIAEIKLGIKTDTLDITGNVLEKKDFNVKKENIEEVFKKFIGKYVMEVPIYSAIKVNGKKLYEYARNNIEVKLPTKTVNIYELELLSYHDDIIRFRTKVEKGTYIRSLIRDICTSLNTIGAMNSLVRTKQGNFNLKNSYNIEDVKNNNFKLAKIKDLLDIPIYHLVDAEYEKVKNGNNITLNLEDKYILLMYKNEEVAIYEKDLKGYKVYVMLKIN